MRCGGEDRVRHQNLAQERFVGQEIREAPFLKYDCQRDQESRYISTINVNELPFVLLLYLRVAHIATQARTVAARPNTMFRISLVATSEANRF